MLTSISKTILAVCAIFASAALLISCDTTSTDDNDDHLENLVGFVIVQNNAEILRFENNKWVLNPNGDWDQYFSEVNGEEVFTISPAVIPDNDRSLTPSVFVRWIDEDGELITLPEEEAGGEYRLEWSWNKPNVIGDECTEEAREQNLDQIRPSNLEQHGSDGSWGFHFRADHVGTAEITFSLSHIDHTDFLAMPLTVHVADAEAEHIVDGVYQHSRIKCRTR